MLQNNTFMIMNNKVICRVCLKSEESEYKSLNDKYKEQFVYEYINSISCVDIKYNDGFSDKICYFCFKQLKTAIRFKEKCEQSNKLLFEITLKKESFYCNNLIKSEDLKENLVKFENEYREEPSTYPDPSNSDVECDNTAKIVIEFPSTQNLQQTLDNSVQCHDCGNKYKSKCKLRVHWKKEHMQNDLICATCKRTFKTYKALRSHKNRKLKSCSTASDDNVITTGMGKHRVFSCKECGYKTSKVKDMATHLVIHNGSRPFQCNLCPKNFTQLSTLQFHKDSVHTVCKPVTTCHVCGKLLKGRRNFQRHLKRHTDDKVTCTVCNKVMNKLSYKTHFKRHSGVKSFTCEKCASTFYTSAELCNHRRWVHNKKNERHVCDLCGYKCIKPSKLKLHKSKHNGKNFACKRCGRFYPSHEKLATHEVSHYDLKKYSCPQCDVKFYNRNSVAKHMKAKHALVVMAEKLANDEIKVKLEPYTKKNLVHDAKSLI